MSWKLKAAKVQLASALAANSIALGFIKNTDSTFSFVGPAQLITEIQDHFEVKVVDELTFFNPTGKAGELIEVPITAPEEPLPIRLILRDSSKFFKFKFKFF